MNPIELETRIQTASPVGAPRTQAVGKPTASGPSFDQVLSEQLTGGAEPLAVTAARANVKFSGHAQTRLASRRITLSGDVSPGSAAP